MSPVDPNDALETRIIDVLADLIDADNDIPPHKTVRYKRPYVVLPGEDTPLVSVWLMNKIPVPRGTESFTSDVYIGVSWQDESVERAVTLMDDPEAYKQDLRVLDRLQQIIFDLAVRGLGGGPGKLDAVGVPEAFLIWLEAIDFLPPLDVETGLVEGYAMAVRVQVIQTGRP